jgi:hypothetical protein
MIEANVFYFVNMPNCLKWFRNLLNKYYSSYLPINSRHRPENYKNHMLSSPSGHAHKPQAHYTNVTKLSQKIQA